MKKYFIIIATTIMTYHIAFALSEREIVKELEVSANNYENSFDDQTLAEWNKAFDKAEKFVLEKSKNVFGKQDQDIITAMKILKEYGNDGIAFFVIKGEPLHPYDKKQYQNRLLIIQKKIDEAINISEKSTKKEAKYMIMVIGLHLKKIVRLMVEAIQP